MGGEGSVGVRDLSSSGVPVRVAKVTTTIDGVPTEVDMQVTLAADREGNVYNLASDSLLHMAVEHLQAIRQLLEMMIGV